MAGSIASRTELLAATAHLSRWDFRHYWWDFLGGEASVGRVARIVFRQVVNKFRHLAGRKPISKMAGRQSGASKGDLDLQPGEWVEIRSRREIVETLDPHGKNRGLSFEPEMLDHCGRRYPVAFQVHRIILEETGAMVELDRTVVLKGVVCEGLCAKNCPRRNFFYWRESWLRRVETPA